MRELTAQQLVILPMVANGCGNGEIASGLYVEVSTVKSHVRDMLFRLGARNRTHAVTVGHELGLLGDPDGFEVRVARIRRVLANYGATRGRAPADSRFARLYDDLQAAVDLRSS